MGSVDQAFAAELRAQADLSRVVETGTFKGVTARRLAAVFPSVTTIELSETLHRRASESLRDLPQVTALQGHSVSRLAELRDPTQPTLYFLDGHWSGGNTEGADDECPALEEIQAIAGGHPDDCLIVDDARLFASAPPPPCKPDHWPTLIELFDALRAQWPDHLVTVIDDQVIAVPERARPAIDAHGLRVQRASTGIARRIGEHVVALRERLGR